MATVQQQTTAVAVYTGASGYTPVAEPRTVRDAADSKAGR